MRSMVSSFWHNETVEKVQNQNNEYITLNIRFYRIKEVNYGV